MNKQHLQITATLLLALLVGCTVPVNNKPHKDSGQVTLVFQHASRTIGVDWANLIKSYSVTLVSKDGNPTLTGSSTTSSLVVNGITAGTWDIHVQALDASTAVVAQAVLGGITLPSAAPIPVMVTPMNGANGGFSFALNFPNTIDVWSGTAQLIPLDGSATLTPSVSSVSAVDANTNQLVVTGSALPSKAYRLLLTLRNSDNATIRYVVEVMNIWDNVTLDSWVAPDGTISSGRTLAASDFKSNVAVLADLAGIIDNVATPLSFNEASSTLNYTTYSPTTTQNIRFVAIQAMPGQVLEFSTNDVIFTPLMTGFDSPTQILNVGANQFYIRVTAQDGSQATLTINITKVNSVAAPTGFPVVAPTLATITIDSGIVPKIFGVSSGLSGYIYHASMATSADWIWLLDGTPVASNSASTTSQYTLNGAALTPGPHTLAVLATLPDGTVISNDEIAVSLNFTVVQNVVARAVSASSAVTMLVKSDGLLWATGDNAYGSFGDGTGTSDSVFRQVSMGAVAVSAGASHTMVVKADGTLWGTGYGLFGAIGDGTYTNVPTFKQVMTGAASVAVGSGHTMVVKADGSLWAAGDNTPGGLGDGTNTGRNTFEQVMPPSDNVSEVWTGGAHSVVLKSNGTLWAAGANSSGQLGIGNNNNSNTFAMVLSGVKWAAAGNNHTVAVATDGTLWTTGRNLHGQLGNGNVVDRNIFSQVPGMTDVASVSAGGDHTMALKTDGALWAAGNNGNGQLGDGTTVDSHSFVQVMTGVASVSAGFFNTFIVKTDGSLWATGSSAGGQFGDGTTTGSTTFKRVQ